MTPKFTVGQTVLLARPDPNYGRYGINPTSFGKGYMVVSVDTQNGQVVVSGHGSLYTAWTSMLDPTGGPW